MDFDIFFSISQTPVDGVTPSESVMFSNFFEQVEAADALGLRHGMDRRSAPLHGSSKATQGGRCRPHWRGEIGLNTDVFQLAHRVFARTKNIHVGSAVMNLGVQWWPCGQGGANCGVLCPAWPRSGRAAPIVYRFFSGPVSVHESRLRDRAAK